MVVAASTSPTLKPKPNLRSQSNPKRPPLLPSERENNVTQLQRRPKSREVSSRYLSTTSSTSTTTTTTTTTTSVSSSSTLSNSSYFSSSRRCASPIPPRISSPANSTSNYSSNTRSLSADRRRPSTARKSVERTSAATKMLTSSSTRSLSVSFQGESFAVSIGKPSATSSVRKSTPERKGKPIPISMTLRGENVRPVDHQLWPGRLRSIASSLSRSIDLSSEGKELINGSAKVVRALERSLIGNGNSNGNKMCSDEIVKEVVDGSIVGSESLASDTDSLSSECNSGSQDSNTSVIRSKFRERSIVVPARLWQEANARLKHGSEPSSPLVRSTSLKGTVNSKIRPPKFVNDSPVATPRGMVSSRGFSSPIRGSMRPSSPSRVGTSFERSSPSRGMASPSRMRNGTTPSVLSFGADFRRIKVGDSRLGDGHFLRLLHNRQLQWRFVNARAEACLSSQKINAERRIYNAWKKTLELREAVSSKRKELQWQRLKLKLVSILKGQMLYLEEWALMDKDHCSSLSGATESLKASIIRLPVVGGARADIQDLKDAICSAADVMQAMAPSICSHLSKVEGVTLLVAEVAGLSSKEHALLSECKDMLSRLAAMQVKDCSLRAHALQLKYASSNLPFKA